MQLELHSSVGITPGVKIMSELPRFTLGLFSNHYPSIAILCIARVATGGRAARFSLPATLLAKCTLQTNKSHADYIFNISTPNFPQITVCHAPRGPGASHELKTDYDKSTTQVRLTTAPRFVQSV